MTVRYVSRPAPIAPPALEVQDIVRPSTLQQLAPAMTKLVVDQVAQLNEWETDKAFASLPPSREQLGLKDRLSLGALTTDPRRPRELGLNLQRMGIPLRA